MSDLRVGQKMLGSIPNPVSNIVVILKVMVYSETHADKNQIRDNQKDREAGHLGSHV